MWLVWRFWWPYWPGSWSAKMWQLFTWRQWPLSVYHELQTHLPSQVVVYPRRGSLIQRTTATGHWAIGPSTFTSPSLTIPISLMQLCWVFMGITRMMLNKKESLGSRSRVWLLTTEYVLRLWDRSQLLSLQRASLRFTRSGHGAQRDPEIYLVMHGRARRTPKWVLK